MTRFGRRPQEAARAAARPRAALRQPSRVNKASAVQIAAKQMMWGVVSGSPNAVTASRNCSDGRDILEESERRIRQPPRRRGEHQQRNRGDRAAQSEQEVGGQAEIAEGQRARAVEPEEIDGGERRQQERLDEQALERIDRRDLAHEAVERERSKRGSG